MNPFLDRREAGRKLATRLGEYAQRSDVTVLALPRGGLPVGYEIARALSVPLDIRVAEDGPGRLTLEARGRDGRLAAEVQMSVRLAVESAESGSRLLVEAEGKVLGKLGALGASVIQRRAEELVDEFVARLRDAIGG